MENLSIEYVYKDGLKSPLKTLYFCRHCMELRSLECVYQHNNSNFCPHCLVNVTVSEAKVLHNRCLSCIICPCCYSSMHTMGFVKKDALNESLEQDEVKSSPGFYFKCPVCKWSTKEGNLPLIETTNTSWPARTNTNQQEFLKYVEYYKKVAVYDTQEYECKKVNTRRSIVMDRFKGKKSPNSKFNAGLSVAALEIDDVKRLNKITLPDPIGPQASDVITALPDHIFNAPLDIQFVTSIEQRLADPEFQPETTSQLYPIHMPLIMKCFQRCKTCDYTIVKCEYNPSNIKFKVQHFAILYLPNISIYTLADMYQDQETELVFTISNPYMHSIKILLENCEDKYENWSTASIELPKSEINISYAANVETFEDNTKEIAGRYKNKVRFYVKVKPQITEGDVKIQFAMRFDMKQTDLKDEAKSMSFCVCLNLGPLKQ